MIWIILKNIIVLHLKFVLIYLIVLIGYQWRKQHYKQIEKNWMYIRDMTEEEISCIIRGNPPVDGWVATILVAFIPIFNIAYFMFNIIMATNDENSEIIMLFKESLNNK